MVYGRCRILEPWNEWDYSIHTDEAQIGRQGRSMTDVYEEFELSHNDKTARFASTSDLPYYDTTLYSCDCYDFQERKLPCKHIYRLAVELGLIEVISRKHNKDYLKEQFDNVKQTSDIDIHPEQQKRQKSAMDKKCTPAEINHEEHTALFLGSGKSPYLTTIDSCTCRDFFVRRLPCKHIYRLRYELDNKG